MSHTTGTPVSPPHALGRGSSPLLRVPQRVPRRPTMQRTRQGTQPRAHPPSPPPLHSMAYGILGPPGVVLYSTLHPSSAVPLQARQGGGGGGTAHPTSATHHRPPQPHQPPQSARCMHLLTVRSSRHWTWLGVREGVGQRGGRRVRGGATGRGSAWNGLAKWAHQHTTSSKWPRPRPAHLYLVGVPAPNPSLL